MNFPAIDPVALKIGPLALHWYGVAYVVGILGWWAYTLKVSDRLNLLSKQLIDDYIPWAVGGVVLGGRLGYVLFYKPAYYLSHPFEIFQPWMGGMAFHGGLLGVIIATALYCRKHNIRFLDFSDVAACGVPIGLFFGRIANFVNGELFGRVTDSQWGMVFPHGGPLPRHPSQLYEAALEGLVLFIILALGIWVFKWGRKRGLLTGVFMLGYALARSTAELFREPDAFLGFLWQHLTMGQILCIPPALWGLWLIVRAKPRAEVA